MKSVGDGSLSVIIVSIVEVYGERNMKRSDTKPNSYFDICCA